MKHLIQLSNKQYLEIVEDHNEIAIYHSKSGVTQSYIASLYSDGVQISTNSGSSIEELTKGLADTEGYTYSAPPVKANENTAELTAEVTRMSGWPWFGIGRFRIHTSNNKYYTWLTIYLPFNSSVGIKLGGLFK
jgi:hypothetical protein